jgi:hypothetical protein
LDIHDASSAKPALRVTVDNNDKQTTELTKQLEKTPTKKQIHKEPRKLLIKKV